MPCDASELSVVDEFRCGRRPVLSTYPRYGRQWQSLGELFNALKIALSL